jgi:hypothetical protein
MRWLIALILILLLALYLWPEPAPVPVEESVIAEPVNALKQAEGFEAEYLDAEEERQKQLEAALEEQSGGG